MRVELARQIAAVACFFKNGKCIWGEEEKNANLVDPRTSIV